jgi:AI-2 transport protein TqsA
MKLQNLAALMIVLSASVMILILGEHLFVPFIFALLIWLLVRRIKSGLNEIPFVRRWFPGWLTNLVMSAAIFAAFAFIAKMLSANIESLVSSYARYQNNVSAVTKNIDRMFGIDTLKLIRDYSGSMNFGNLFTSVFFSLRGILQNAVVILLYVAFIFLEGSYFQVKLRAIFSNGSRYYKVMAIAEKIEASVANYIGLKTLVNLLSAGLSYVILLCSGIDSPLFWAFLLFVLNFIPVIGLLIGTLLPAVFALIQFGSFTPALLLFFSIGGIQFAIGNIVEPRIMGNSLNISPLVAIIALAFWGSLWGITGMFLSVPITVIMIIVFSQFEKTRPLAILFSEKGNV